MRFRHILAALASPQLISPSAGSAIVSLIQSRMMAPEGMPTRESQGMCGDLIEEHAMSMIEGEPIAVIPVDGVMGVKLTGMEKGSGAVDTGDIISELKFCQDCPDISAVIMHFDTPGGMYQGTPELAYQINAMTKPVVALIDNAHSAGIWAASCCDAMLMKPSSSAGSIGVYQGYYDVTSMLDKMGVKAELFTSGPYKGMGFAGVPLTDPQKVLMQERVDALANEFKAHIKSMCGSVPEEMMQGQSFSAEECLCCGLADEIVMSMDEAVELTKLLMQENSRLTINLS